MKKMITAFFMLISLALFAQNHPEVKIYTQKEGFVRLAKLGIPVDEGYFSKEGYLHTVISAGDLKKVREAGFVVEILKEDYPSYVEKRNIGAADEIKRINREKSSKKSRDLVSYPVPQHFELGSMGGYYNMTEVYNEMDSMHLLYPGLTSARTTCSAMNSIEGRPLYYIRFTNPNATQPKQKILYNALTHAREPMGMQQLIFFMWYLLENYDTNDEARYLMDNLELYFIPVVNVDGFEYNHTTFPNGGGDWRKNRRNNGDGSFGIDLNRNFGYMWGYDDFGSSPVTSEETYRGTSAFSEPETQIMRDFCIANGFLEAMNYHTFSDLFLYPWCYITQVAPDSSVLLNYANLMTRMNRYTSGTPGEVLYNTNGDINDWLYGDQTSKPKVMSFTAEVGSDNDGFWPAPWQVIPLCEDNMYQNLMLAHLALKYAEATDDSPVILEQKQGYLKFNFERYGMEEPGTYSVSVEPLDSNVIIQTGAAKTFTAPGQFTVLSDSLSYTLAPGVAAGAEISYILKCSNGLYTFSDTVTKWYGPVLTVFSDDCDQFTNWTSTKWNVTNAISYSPPGSITDSPSGNYSNNSTATITTTNSVDLKDSPVAVLEYQSRWDLENTFDFVQVSTSVSASGPFTVQSGRYTKNGSLNEDRGKPVYDGTQTTWVKEEVALTDYLNQDIYIRFKLKSDEGVARDGFYFDDFRVRIIDMSGVGTNDPGNNDLYLSDPAPNPASEKTTVSYSSAPDKSLTLILYDSKGNILQRKLLHAGRGEVVLNIDNFSSGIYFYRLVSSEGNSAIKKLIVIRD